MNVERRVASPHCGDKIAYLCCMLRHMAYVASDIDIFARVQGLDTLRLCPEKTSTFADDA